MICRQYSLARLLTTKMVMLQVLMLTILAVSLPLLEVIKGHSTLYNPDPKISTDIAGALQSSGSGLSLAPDSAFETLLAEAPNLWFVATDASGRRLDYGAVPQNIAEAVPSIGLFAAAEFADDSVPGGNALLAVEDTPAGEVRLIFGNGPVIDLWRALLRSGSEVLPPTAMVLALLAISTFLVIPRLVSMSLAGMCRIVERAKLIDGNSRGKRLPLDNVPMEIAALVEAMNDALKRIDDGYERQQRFLADTAHELRTPIAILQNRIELLAEGELCLDDSRDRLLLDVKRVSNLAEQLLDLQRIDHDNAPFSSVDLGAVAKQVVADIAPLAIDAGYDPQVTIGDPPTIVLGDRAAIERALINLVQNAVAHGGSRGTILVHVEGGAISVSDDGQGIDPQHRERIFEPFHRLRPKNRGAGLGLSLVRETMDRHNGSVEVGTSTTGGARFTLQFATAKDRGDKVVHLPVRTPVAA